MDFDDFEDAAGVDFNAGGFMPDMADPQMMGMGGQFNGGPPSDIGDFSGLGGDFGDLGSMDGFGGSDMGNFDSDFGMLDGGMSTASLPPLSAIGGTNTSSGLGPPPSAAPMWVPNNVNSFGGGSIVAAKDTRLTCCICCCMFFVLFLLMAGLVAIGIVMIVKVFQIEYDVNHLTLVTVQDVNPPPTTLPPQIILPY